jgi:hypothetical protein
LGAPVKFRGTKAIDAIGETSAEYEYVKSSVSALSMQSKLRVRLRSIVGISSNTSSDAFSINIGAVNGESIASIPLPATPVVCKGDERGSWVDGLNL